MIGKGKSIAHTGASMSYGWNQEKGAEIVCSQNITGENPKEITKEFEMVQSQNCRCENNTLSFVLSPTIEDGKILSKEQLGEITQKFLKEMDLKDRQAVAFVHRDKEHLHIHAYVNRVGFDRQAYKDNYIGKRSQYAAEQVAKDMGLTTVREVQQAKQEALQTARQQIRDIHKEVMQEYKPKNFEQYIKYMRHKEVKVIPSINKSNKLQGFRFQYKGYNLKGSEVHRSMSGGKLAIEISKDSGKELFQKKGKEIGVQLMGKVIELSGNMAIKVSKKIAKQVIKKTIDLGMGI